MEIRKLALNDFEQVKQLIDMRNKRVRGLEWAPQSILTYFDSRDDLILYGCLQDGLLQSTLGIVYWGSMPYTTLKCMLTRAGSQTLFNIDKSGIQHCFEAALSDAEKRGYYTHYSARSVRELRVEYKRNVWKPFEDQNPRWIGVNEAFVPANTKPDFSAWWNIMGKELHPYDVMIYSTRLRNEFRFNEQFPDISAEVLSRA